MKKVNETKKGSIVAILAMILFILFASFSLYQLRDKLPEFVAKVKEGEQKEETAEDERKGSSSFSFVGVGDNLIHGAIYYYQEQAHNGYNFDDLYTLTNPY
ncbi:MAG: hypothetical protein KBT48_10270, partial [Firmicutes bacterium]|nr:hypothetical protein [Bacillota bacterium]